MQLSEFLPFDRPRRIALGAALGLLLLHLALTAGLGGDGAARSILLNGLPPAASAAAAGALFWAARRQPAHRQAWTLLGLSQVANFLGAVLRLMLAARPGGAPVPSLADVVYLSSYPLFLAGVLSYRLRPLHGPERLSSLFENAIAILAAIITIWSLLVGHALQSGQLFSGRGMVAAAFPLADLVILIALLRLLSGIRLRRLVSASAAPFTGLMLAAATALVTDTIYGAELVTGAYQSGNWVDTGWIIAIALTGLAGVWEAQFEYAPAPRLDTLPILTWTAYVPYVALGVAYLAIMVQRTYPESTRQETVALLLVIGLVLLHQIVALGQNVRLLAAERRQRTELAVLHRLATASASATTVDDLIARAMEILRELYISYFELLLYDEAAGELVIHGYHAQSPMDPHLQNVPVSQGIVGRAFRTGRPSRIDDVRQEPDYIAVSALTRSELAVPLAAGGRVIGVLNAESENIAAFNASDERLLLTVAGQLANAISKLQLFERERRQVATLTALHETGLDLSSQLDLANLLHSIVERAVRLLGARFGLLFLRNAGASEVELVVSPASPDLVGARLKAGEGLAGRVLASGDTMVVGDYSNWEGRAEVFQERGWHSLVGVPLTWERGVVGVLVLGDDRLNHYSGADVDLVRLFAGQAAVAIANARLFEAAERRARELASVHQTVVAAASVLDTAGLLHRMYEQLRPALDPDTFVIAFYHEQTDEVEVALVVEQGQELPPVRVPISEAGLTGWVIQNRQTLSVGDLAVDAVPVPPQHLGPPARAWLGVPLIARDRLLGAVSIQSFRPNAFDLNARRVLESLASQVAVALENASLYAALADDKRRLELLYDLSQNLTSTLNAREVARRGLEQICTALGNVRGLVFGLEEDSQRLRLLAGNGPPDIDLEEADKQLNLHVGEGLAGWVAAERTTAVVEDVRQDSRWRHAPGLDDWVRSSISLPLVAGDELVGVLSLHSGAPQRLNYEQMLFLTAASASVAVALQNARLFAAEARRALDLMLLNDMTRTAVEISDFDQLLMTLDDRLIELLSADSARIVLWTSGRAAPLVPGSLAGSPPFRGDEIPQALQSALAESVVAANATVALEDLAAWSPAAAVAAETPFRSVLGLPLIAGEQMLGAALVFYRQAHHFTREETGRGEQAAVQIALALAKALLFEETRRSAEESQAVSEILRSLNAVPDVSLAFPAIAAGLKRISSADRVSLALLDEGRQSFVMAALDQPRAELSQGVRLHISNSAAASDILSGRLHLTPDLTTETDFPAEKTLYQAGYRSRVNLPLRVGPDALGSLNLVWRETAGYANHNLALFEQIADAVALAVEKNRLFAETRRRADELAMLLEISTALRAARTVDEMLPLFLLEASDIVGPGFLQVFLLDTDTNELVLRACQPHDAEIVGQRHRWGEGITGRVAATGQAYVSLRPTQDPVARFVPGEERHWAEIGATISLPLRSEDQVVGVFNIGVRDERDFADREVHLLTAIAEIAGNALHRANVVEHLEQRVVQRTTELAQANDRLKELDRLKDRFVSNVSHELRTPLTNIKLHLGLLEKRGAVVMDRYLPILQQETERLRRLIEDLLNLSRLQTQTGLDSREPHRLADIAGDVMTAHTTAAEARSQVLRVEAAADLLPVPVDRAQMMQVFTNLVANAIAYAPRGGHITITIQPAAGGGQTATFHNDGPPIAPEDLPHIFERFYRGQTGHDSGEPGTGLGLAISKEIVERHGGQISVQSTAEAGTIFAVFLPLEAG